MPVKIEDLDEEEIEVDNLGIPTVMLRVKHSLTEQELARRKKKRKRTHVVENGVSRKLMWYEEWEEGEGLRTCGPVNSLQSRVDRLHYACQDFRTSRTWPNVTSGLPQLWDAFRLYIGIISYIPQPGGRLKPRPQEEEEEDEDDDEDAPSSSKVEVVDEGEARARFERKLQQEAEERRKNSPLTDEQYQARLEKRKDMKDNRMDFFFDDMEMAMKIFFSSHYRDKGLMWDRVRCRDGPILIEFFFRFVIRNRVLPEYEKELKKALEIVRLAKKELLQTFVIGETLLDKFAQGCEQLWGSKVPTIYISLDIPSTTPDPPPVIPARDRAATDEEQKKFAEFVASQNTNAEAINLNDTDFDTADKRDAVADNVDVNGLNVDPAWGSCWGNNSGGTSGWGQPVEGSESHTAWGDPEGGSWGKNDTSGGWGDNTGSSTWTAPKLASLVEFMGPTALPITHTTGIVERSTRKIHKIVLPRVKSSNSKRRPPQDAAGFVEEEFEARFAYVVLSPWKKIGNHVASDVQPPAILKTSRGEIFEAIGENKDKPKPPRTHDPTKDDIWLLMEPATAENLSMGMGLLGTWIQIARKDTKAGDELSSCQTHEEYWGPTKYWYVEELLATLPSYHADKYFPGQA